MKILIVSATENEIQLLKKDINKKDSALCVRKYTVIKNFIVDFLITGVGGVLTTYNLLKALSVKKYDVVINVGIAGSFNSELKIGDTVFVQTDQFADLGIEDKDELFTVFEKDFIPKNQFPFKNSLLENSYEFDFGLKKVSAITVNTTHGSRKNIELFKNKFNADIETMEGAAFFYVCLNEGVNFFQIRTISNYVEERNEANWNIPLAIKNLTQQLLDIINVIVDTN
ncbi:MAG: futalosine hydrolase [Bacteroidales bacterium]|jgi:futalosine hydrolase|nr:futalosine hydrolase [Bacteroidales bacterium]